MSFYLNSEFFNRFCWGLFPSQKDHDFRLYETLSLILIKGLSLANNSYMLSECTRKARVMESVLTFNYTVAAVVHNDYLIYTTWILDYPWDHGTFDTAFLGKLDHSQSDSSRLRGPRMANFEPSPLKSPYILGVPIYNVTILSSTHCSAPSAYTCRWHYQFFLILAEAGNFSYKKYISNRKVVATLC